MMNSDRERKLKNSYESADNSLGTNRFREEIGSAKELVRAAETLLDADPGFAGVASFLCFQSAKQMMSAFIDLRDLEIVDDGDMTVDLWQTCLNDQDVLDGGDDAVQKLLDCEWACCPEGVKGKPPTPDFAYNAIRNVKTLELMLVDSALNPTMHNQELDLESFNQSGLCQAAVSPMSPRSASARERIP